MTRPLRWIFLAAGVIAVVSPIAILSTFPAYIQPTGSMEKTLLVGDRFLLKRDTSVARGDIIAFRYPVDPSQTYLKRVVGVPGDRIRIVNKQLFLNGVVPKEPYVAHSTDYTIDYRDNFPSQPSGPVEIPALSMLTQHVRNGEIIVPPDAYFVLGDNRDNSADSRYWGFVPKDLVIGKPWIIYWRKGFALQKITGYPLGR